MTDVRLLTFVVVLSLVCCYARAENCSCVGGCDSTMNEADDRHPHKVNVALGKAARVSSMELRNTLTTGARCNPCLAVDGLWNDADDNMEFPLNASAAVSGSSGRCMQCDYVDFGGWWEVDLGRQYTITELTIYTGSNSSLQGSNVHVDDHICFTFYNVSGANETKIDAHCWTPVTGRVVKLGKPQVTGDISSPAIHLCEVVVWGCAPGYYGPGCASTCGQCEKDKSTCDPVTGHCASGCLFGWQGLYCNASTHECACADPADGGCDYVPSISPDGVVNKENVAFGKKASMSSRYKSGDGLSAPACAAVNGRTRTRYQTLNQPHPNCAHTDDYDYSPWWKVDLARPYTVTGVTVYRRSDYSESYSRMAGARIWVDNQLCYSFPTSNDTHLLETLRHKISVTCTTPLRGHVIAFTKDGDDNSHYFYPINICEFQVWVCKDGFYGDYCNQTCSEHCPDHLCDNYNGTCLAATGQPGCTPYHYGENCTGQCGHCTGGQPCDQRNGQCPGGCLLPGYLPPMCLQACPNRTYGQDCKDHCGHCKDQATCDVRAGHCQECSSAFRLPFCTECADGWYGPDCDKPCENCDLTGSCDPTTGRCLYGCKAGWRKSGLDLCDQSCPRGTFGKACKHTCGKCQRSVSCRHDNGTCPGGCEEGYEGIYCLTKMKSGHAGNLWYHLKTGPLAGVIAGGLGVIALSVIVIGICRCRQQQHKDQSTGTESMELERTQAAPPPYCQHPAMVQINLSPNQETSTEAEDADVLRYGREGSDLVTGPSLSQGHPACPESETKR